MTKNRFEEITHFIHFNDSSIEPPRGDELYDRLYKARPILNAFNHKMLDLYKPKKKLSKADCRSDNICQQSPQNMVSKFG